MKYFTKSQIEEIQKALATWGMRDTDFETVSTMRETDFIAIVRDGMNRIISPSVFCKAAAEYVGDALTVESAYQVALDCGFVGTEEEWLQTLFLAQVVDNLDSNDTTKALSAKQGKMLKGMIDALPSYTVKSWADIRATTIDSDSKLVLANAKTAYELYKKRLSSVTFNNNSKNLSIVTADGTSFTADLTHTHPDYEQAIAALQQAVETGTGGSGNASLVDNGSYYTLGVGNVQTDIYSKNQIDGKKITIADIPVGLGESITTSALKTALGISGSGTTSNVVLSKENGYDVLSVTIGLETTTDTFYNKSQVDALISGGGGGGGTTYKLAGDVEGGSGVTTIQTSIVNGHVVEAKLAVDAVTTAKIKNLNVTTDKLADKAVNGLKINDNAKSITLWGKQFNIGGANGTTATTITGDIKYIGKLQFVDPLNPTGTSLVETLEVVNIAGTGETPVYALHSNLPFYSDGFISAGGLGSGSGGGGSLPVGSVGKYLKYVEGTGGAASSWQAANVTLGDIKAATSSTLSTDMSSFLSAVYPQTPVGYVIRSAGNSNWAVRKLSIGDIYETENLDGDVDNQILKYTVADGWVLSTLSAGGGSYNFNSDSFFVNSGTTPPTVSLNYADSGKCGGFQLWGTDPFVTPQNVQLVTTGQNYAIQMTRSGQLYVNVPSSGGSGSIAAGNGIAISTVGNTSTVSVKLKNGGGLAFDSGELYATGGGGGSSYTFDSDNFTVSNNVVSLNAAESGKLGGFSLWSVDPVSSPTVNSLSTTSDKYYAVQMNQSGQLYVNVPWTGGSGGGGEANVIEAVSLNGSTAPISSKTAALSITYNSSAITASSGEIDLKSTLDNNYLPLSGGTMTGTINSRSLIPTGDSVYDLGSSSLYYNHLYINTITLNNGEGSAATISMDESGNVVIDGDLVVTGAVTAGEDS